MKTPSIIDCFTDRNLFRPCFENFETWKSWMIFDKAIFGLSLNNEEYELYKKCTKRTKLQSEGYDTIYAICGRRGGKSRNAALIAVYLALFGGFEKKLASGQTGYVFLLGTDRQQAKEILGYCEGILQDARLENMVKGKVRTLDIPLKNGITIAVKPASFRSTRGYTTCAIILDELAFFRSENSANPASEIITSLLPTLVKGGKIIGISTPYTRFGFLYEQYKKHWGKNKSNILIWKADTRTMNPTYDAELMRRNIELDPTKMQAEYYAEFRTDIENFFGEKEIIDIMAIEDYQPYKPEFQYQAFVDSSTGRHDSFTLAIAHLEENRQIEVDALFETKSPFNPDSVIRNYSDILKQYNIYQVEGDMQSGGWEVGSFKTEGINYIKSSFASKSEIYLYFRTLVSQRKVSIPKDERLKTQLLLLERKELIGGKTSIDHPRGAKDDCANSVAGVCAMIDKGIQKLATAEELRGRLPHTSHRLYAWKNPTI